MTLVEGSLELGMDSPFHGILILSRVKAPAPSLHVGGLPQHLLIIRLHAAEACREPQ
jgi:hypothetical protein